MRERRHQQKTAAVRDAEHALARTASPVDASTRTPANAILELQRAAGNRAVCLLLQRQEDPWDTGSARPPTWPQHAPTSKQGRWEAEFVAQHPDLQNVGWVAGPRDDGIQTPSGIRVPATRGNMLNPRRFYEQRDAAFVAYQGFCHYAELLETGNRKAATMLAVETLNRTGRQMPRDSDLDLDGYARWQRKAAAARQTVEFGLLAAGVAIAGRALIGAWRGLRSSLGGASSPRGPGAASIYDESFAQNRVYKLDTTTATGKHLGKARKAGGVTISAEPRNGQRALDHSFPVLNSEGQPGKRRIGVDLENQQIVVLDRTGNQIQDKKVVGGQYHGHVRTWDDLEKPMQDALTRNGINVNNRGKITATGNWIDE